MEKFLHIHPADNVAVALADLQTGMVVSTGSVTVVLKEDIPAGHKIALTDLKMGDVVVKYGFPIGALKADRPAGTLINEKYLKTLLGEIKDYTYTPVEIPSLEGDRKLSFRGYERKNGEAGIRNEIWIVPTVGCVNGVANELVKLFNEKVATAEPGTEGFEGIHVFTHTWGCSQLSDDHENTRKILRDMILHPNAGGVLVLGLGCENNQVAALKTLLGDYDADRIKFMECQKVDDEIAAGLQILSDLYETVKQDKRVDIPVSKLKIGLKCGGSDGFSGITGNPLLGRFSDQLIACGGTCVLTEVPEMFGAETILMGRCINREVFDKTVSLINNFKNYFIRNGQEIYENPSPGNKAGGISTLEEKSLGCTQKSGSSAVMDVMEYGDRICTSGLNLLSAPGNDLVASTALAASGCHLVLFTTGRGTPFGTFVPTLKVSTNSLLYQHKQRWMDFNAGVIAEGVPMQDVQTEFFRFVMEICSGKRTKNEENNYREISIFKTGVIL